GHAARLDRQAGDRRVPRLSGDRTFLSERGDRPRHSLVRGPDQARYRAGRLPRRRPSADGALDCRSDAAGHPVEDRVRANRRREARCEGAPPPSRRSDAARFEAPTHEARLMTRRALTIVVAAATVVIAAGVWFEGPLASVLGFGSERTRYLGYVEGETSLIAPPTAGRLVERPVERGDTVKKGQRLFVIDPVVAQAEVSRAEGQLAEAKARYENLLKGKRQEEKDVTTMQRRETEAALAMAEVELKRQTELVAK